MALIDFEAAWLDLASEMQDRQGIGRDGLLALMKRLEVKHALDEGAAERGLRLYGIGLSEDLRAAARGDEQVKEDGNGYATAADDGVDPRAGTPLSPVMATP